MAVFSDRLWLGSFDEGLCVTGDGASYQRIADGGDAPLRMINDLLATPHGLYVAAASGLFVSRDGQTFRRVAFVSQGGVNGLAFDGRSLWATTPGALWRIRVHGGPRDRAWWRPGGSTAVQSVAVHGRTVWLASEDRGAIRMHKGAFTLFDRAAGLPTSWATDIAVAPGGTVYVATLRHGAIAIDRRGRVRTLGGLPDAWILAVDVVGSSVWIGTQDGAARVDGQGRARAVRDLPHPSVHAACQWQGALYLATEGGLRVSVSDRPTSRRPGD
jgi:ligand-binding sensor domain-containing protein